MNVRGKQRHPAVTLHSVVTTVHQEVRRTNPRPLIRARFGHRRRLPPWHAERTGVLRLTVRTQPPGLPASLPHLQSLKPPLLPN
ncbi:hypothetical protein CRENBAI_016068 [Crenichthys baileyi]|uniref:Uncharacterized protein n=1 Tax=Crenichthys baileyi TaxID=28760 RepID=A0AAV9RJF0_9TELE